jgi:hypothetical protein
MKHRRRNPASEAFKPAIGACPPRVIRVVLSTLTGRRV